MSRPDFIKNCGAFETDPTSTYPGDDETFGAEARLAKEMGLKRIAVNYEVLEPGDRSSWPHAHSTAEEFIFVLEGNGHVWVDGEIYQVSPGDCVSFLPGTGKAHCLINNSNEQVRFLVVGEQNTKLDKVFYAKHSQRNEDIKKQGWFWDGHPFNKMGAHDGQSDKKRTKQKSIPEPKTP